MSRREPLSHATRQAARRAPHRGDAPPDGSSPDTGPAGTDPHILERRQPMERRSFLQGAVLGAGASRAPAAQVRP